MKTRNLFIAVTLITFSIIPVNRSDAKTEKVKEKLVVTSIAEYEKLKHEILIAQFFKKYDEIKKGLIQIENNLK